MNSKTLPDNKPKYVHASNSAGIIMIAFVCANLLGLVRQVIINRTFGTSPVLDAYFAAFRVPDLIFHIIAGGALGSAFIPTFASLLTRESKLKLGNLLAQ